MSLFPESLIEQVRQALDAGDVLLHIDYRPETIQDCGDRIKCFCPIHHETIFRTLVIEKADGTYRCSNFSCDGNAGGDLIDLFARARGISYEQALLALAGAVGLTIDDAVIESFHQTTLEVARNYLDLGALAEAEEHLTGLLSIRPQSLAALETLAEVHARQGRRDALQATRLQWARALAQDGRYDDALACIDAALADEPDNEPFARLRVETLHRAGRTEEAAAALLALAADLTARGEIQLALETYRDAQAMAVDGVDAWGPMIQLLLHAGRREEAIVECVRAAEHLLAAGDADAAHAMLEQAVELDPAREDLVVRLAAAVAHGRLTGEPLESVCRRLEQLLAAQSHGAVGRALDVLEPAFPDHVGVACLRADLEEARGNDEHALDLRLALVDRLESARDAQTALAILDKLIGAAPGNVALLSRRANLLRAMDRVEQAVEAYLEIVDLFRQIDEIENAIAVYQTVINMQPGEMEHRRRQQELFLQLGNERVIVEQTMQLTQLYLERGEAPEACRLLERALEAVPQSAELLDHSGSLYEECGRRGEAAESFVAAGRLFHSQGRGEEAQQALERALRCVPEHLEARELLADVLLRRGETLQAIGILTDLSGFYQREGRPDVVIRLCRRVLSAQPDHLPTLLVLAEAHELSGEVDLRNEVLIHIVDLYMRAEDWGRATRLCDEILSHDEDCVAAIERLATISQATRRDEQSLQQLWQLAQATRRAGRAQDEMAALERLLEVDPLHVEAWQRLMEMRITRLTPRSLAAAVNEMCDRFEAAGRIEHAIEILDTLIREAESPKPELCAGLARLYEAAGDGAGLRRSIRMQAELLGRLMRDAEALDAWDRLAVLEPNDHNILRMRIELMKRNEMTDDLAAEFARLAEALARTGHDDQARVALLEVINMRPRDIRAREQMIDLMLRRGDRVGARQQIEEAASYLLEDDLCDHAIALYERILTFDPEDQPTFHKIIAIHQRMDRMEEAMAVYERLLDVLEKRPDGFEFEQAAQDALHFDPDNDRIRRRLADFYVREDRPQEAEALLLTLAVNQMEKGLLDEAGETLDLLLTIHPESVPGRAHRAQLLARRGATEEALDEFISLTGRLALQKGLESLIQPQDAVRPGAASGPGNGRPYQLIPYEGIALVADYTFDNFIVGERNNFAHAAALAAARAPGRNYNPLFLYSDVGLGKTHLCHAMAHYVRDHHPHLKVRYITMEEFVTGLIDAIGRNTIASFRGWHKVIDVLIVDDVQFLSGKERAQEEFFHIFNTLYQAGKQVVLTSDRPPKDIAHLEKRLKSRFGSGIIVDIQPPELETRVAILRHELAVMDRTGLVADEVLLFIAEHAADNVRELKAALKQVLARCELSGHALDLVLARKVLDQSLVQA